MTAEQLAAALTPVAPTPEQEARIGARIRAGIQLDRWALRLPQEEAVEVDVVAPLGKILDMQIQGPTAHRTYGQDAVVRSFSAPRPFIEAVNATAKARGLSISELVREGLLAIGVSPEATLRT